MPLPAIYRLEKTDHNITDHHVLAWTTYIIVFLTMQSVGQKSLTIYDSDKFAIKLITKMIFAMSAVTFLLVASIFMGASGEVFFKKGSPQVKLGNEGQGVSGQVQFSREGRPYNSFLGIPYSETPERFQEPKLLSNPSWEGVLDATKAGSACPQFYYTGTSFGQEDCLFINIYVPMNNTRTGEKGYPVMFHIHGGGFMMGDSITLLDPRYFMDEDVIMVTINYRVGALGFLSTGDNTIIGNLGLKDMVVALQWVQKNVGKFGGDQGKVTIVGCSGGGAAVQYLLMSPSTKGLFHGAISQSGTALSTWAYQPNPKRNAVELANYMNCPKDGEEITSEEILECLKKATFDELTSAQVKFRKRWPVEMNNFFFAPTTEPKDQVSQLTPFLSEAPITILSKKRADDLPNVPVIIGATEDEGSSMYAEFVLTNPKFMEEINENWNEVVSTTLFLNKYISDGDELKRVTDKLKEFYFDGKAITVEEGRLGLANLFSDALFQYGVLRAAVGTASKENSKPVYLYQYAYNGPISLMGMFTGGGVEKKELDKKVGHGDDIQHQFYLGNLPGMGDLMKSESPDEDFSKNFARLWASFAIHGEPKHEWGSASEKKWKPISKNELDGKNPLSWLRLVANPACIEINQSVKDRMKFWDSLWEEHLTTSVLDIIKSNQKESSAKKTEL